MECIVCAYLRFLWQAFGWGLLLFAFVNIVAATFDCCLRMPFNLQFELSRWWLCGLALAGWKGICYAATKTTT